MKSWRILLGECVFFCLSVALISAPDLILHWAKMFDLKEGSPLLKTIETAALAIPAFLLSLYIKQLINCKEKKSRKKIKILEAKIKSSQDAYDKQSEKFKKFISKNLVIISQNLPYTPQLKNTHDNIMQLLCDLTQDEELNLHYDLAISSVQFNSTADFPTTENRQEPPKRRSFLNFNQV